MERKTSYIRFFIVCTESNKECTMQDNNRANTPVV